MEIKRKTVSFNVADPDQLAMFEHACQRTNFSAYIKRLIQRDLEGGNKIHVFPLNHKQERVDEDLMEGLI